MATNDPQPPPKHSQYISTGKIMKLPSTNLELAARRRQHHMHKGINLVDSSIAIGRAMNEAIIFTFGLSGAGKSSTLNHLFGVNLSPTSATTSCTRHVSHYVACMSSTDWEVDNLRIGFVDIPGWGDNNGLHQQAKNMAAVETFLSAHSQLGRSAPKCYPNVVMIIASGNDNRADGPQSSFVIMLKAIKRFGIIDCKRFNVIIVMTHTMPDIADIPIKKEIYQRLCSKVFGIEPPFVYIENRYESYDEIKNEEDWTIIPDEMKTKQPCNVFNCIIDQMKRNGDEVGVEAVRLFFSSRKDSVLIEESRVESSKVSEKLTRKWHSFSGRRADESLLTEVTQIINHHIEKWTTREQNKVQLLKTELYSKNYCDANDFTNLSIVKVQLKLLPCILREFEINLIIQLFQVEPMNGPEILHQVMFSSYKLPNIESIPNSQIHFDFPHTQHISQGLKIPIFLKANTFYNSDRRIIEIFEKQEIDGAHRNLELTFVIKEIVFEFKFDYDYPTSNIKLKQYLLDSIRKLHHAQDDTAQNAFFEKYGHLIVIRSSSGGWIEGTMCLSLEQNKCNFVQNIIRNSIETILSNANIDEFLELDCIADYRDIIHRFLKTEIKFHGGRGPLFCDNMEKLKIELYNSWVVSLHEYPFLFDIETKDMTNLYSFIQHIDPEQGNIFKKPEWIVTSNRFDKTQNGGLDATIIGSPTQEIPTHDVEPAIQPQDKPLSREKVANNAKTNAFRRAIVGFPGSSLIYMHCPDETFQEVPLNQLQQHMDTADKPVKVACYCIEINGEVLSHISTTPKQDEYNSSRDYTVVSFGGGSVKLGCNQNILRSKMFNGRINEGFVKVSELVVGETIFIFNPLKKIMENAMITNMGYEPHIGWFNPTIERGNLVVDQVVTREDIQDNQCFPGNATVVLRGGERVRMDELKIGDYVLSIHPTTYKPVYSKVYLWAHRDPHITATFLHITHPHGHLHISANHLILTGDNNTPVPAHQLRVGDSIHLLYEQNNNNNNNNNNNDKKKERGDSHTLISVHVLHIHTCTQLGYYTPFTNNGLIVVDNIATSVYCQFSTHSQSETSSTWLCHTLTRGLVQQFGMHRVGQCVLTPVRVGCKLGMGSVLSRQMDTHSHIHKYCQWLLSTFHS